MPVFEDYLTESNEPVDKPTKGKRSEKSISKKHEEVVEKAYQASHDISSTVHEKLLDDDKRGAVFAATLGDPASLIGSTAISIVYDVGKLLGVETSSLNKEAAVFQNKAAVVLIGGYLAEYTERLLEAYGVDVDEEDESEDDEDGEE